MRAASPNESPSIPAMQRDGANFGRWKICGISLVTLGSLPPWASFYQSLIDTLRVASLIERR